MSRNVLVSIGQQQTSARSFKKKSSGLVRQSLLSILISILLLSISSVLMTYGECNSDKLSGCYGDFNNYKFYAIIGRQSPFFLGPAFAFVGACIYLNWRRSRDLSIEIVSIINGDKFLKERFYLIEIISSSDGIEDIENILDWFPSEELSKKMKYGNIDDFLKDHALANIAYLTFQIYTYASNGLIDQNTPRKLFHFFFSHYNMLLLEFAYALKATRKKLAAKDAFDARWDEFPDGILGFLRLVGLADRLPCNHKFRYFPESGSV